MSLHSLMVSPSWTKFGEELAPYGKTVFLNRGPHTLLMSLAYIKENRARGH
jgi:hypothetical protein